MKVQNLVASDRSDRKFIKWKKMIHEFRWEILNLIIKN